MTNKTPTFDIIITCMGRLEHLKQSLPQLLKQQSAQCFLVDYSCPDHCGEWVEKQGLPATVIRIQKQTFFNISKARNAGAKVGNAPWLLFTDADMLLADNFIQQIIGNLNNGYSYHPSQFESGNMGTFICQRQYFQAIFGYDEVINGWGGEDNDLYERLAIAGVKKSYFPVSQLSYIVHSDRLRTTHYAEKNIHESRLGNYLYISIIRNITRLTGFWPNRKTREQFYENALTTIQKNQTDKGHSDLYINLRKEIVRNTHTELSTVLHFHLDKQAGQWQPGQSKPLELQTDTFDYTLRALKKRWPALQSSSEESPLFLLASGFRSGSTLLQRILFKQCWTWGEPYGHSGLIDHLIAPLLQINETLPPNDFFADHERFQSHLERTFIANLYPDPEHLLAATVDYFERLFKTPAMNKGFHRWGFKEVRLNAEHAKFLRWLYPRACLLFLYRNPYDAYRSYRKFPGAWYLQRKPDNLIDTPEKFARHWLKTTQSFIKQTTSLNALSIRYEDLIKPNFDWKELENHVGFTVDKSALQHRVGGHPKGGFNTNRDISKELAQVASIVDPLASQLGYHL